MECFDHARFVLDVRSECVSAELDAHVYRGPRAGGRYHVSGKRLAVYEQETKPVLDYYGPALVHTIDSTQTPVNVLRDILRVITLL